jgi:hypothetical protein
VLILAVPSIGAAALAIKAVQLQLTEKDAA